MKPGLLRNVVHTVLSVLVAATMLTSPLLVPGGTAPAMAQPQMALSGPAFAPGRARVEVEPLTTSFSNRPTAPRPQPTESPLGIEDQAGQRVSLSGWLTVIWGDGKPGSNVAVEIYMLTDDQGKSTQLSLDEKLLQSLGGILSLNGRRVIAEGEFPSAPTRGVGPATLRVQSIRLTSEAKAPVALKAATGVSGSQPWISILCKFADVITETKPLTYFQGMFSSNFPGLDHYWREVSYDNINVVGSGAVGWYTLPQPRSYYVYDRNDDGQVELDHGRAADDCTAVADPYVYFPNYVGVNLMFNDNLDCCAWGGGYYMTKDGVSQVWHMTWEPPWGYGNLSVMEHEMGHGFGLPHSSGAYGQTYDNQWDVMSDAWSGCGRSSDPMYGCLGQHTISYHKDKLGWMTAGRKYTVTPGGRVTITLEQLALPQTGNYLMAHIPIRGSSALFYTVEARRWTGYDIALPGEAVIIHEVDTTRGIPAHVIDVDNNGNTGDAGAMWLPGETFSDTVHGITVTINSTTTTGFVVTIDNRSFPIPCYVAPTGTDSGNDCTNSATPCSTIQHAVDLADSCDEIRVAAGTYAGVSARDSITQAVYISRTVLVRGGYTTTNWTASYPITQPTTLDAQGRGRVLYIANNVQPTLEGLHILGGNAAGLGGGWGDSGGGIYVAYSAAPTIRNCTILSNTAQTGGGLFLDTSSATLNGNTVMSNTAWNGGGILALWSGANALNGNIVISNTAEYGGGLYLYSSSPAMLTNNVIVGNRVSYNGSGLYVNGSYPRLLHTTIARNSGGDGSGVYVTGGSTVALTNTILVSQMVGIFATSSNTATLEATLWGSGAWANGSDWGSMGSISTGTINVHGDPAFVNPNSGDYHIRYSSAAINAGVDAGVASDMDGEPRPHGDGFDIGADEFSSPPALIIFKQANPDPVPAGAQLTYTIWVTNISDVTLHAAVTDTLPAHVAPGGVHTWTPVITAPTGVWTQQIVVTVEVGYAGLLTNVVKATTLEGATGIYTRTCIALVLLKVYMPLIAR